MSYLKKFVEEFLGKEKIEEIDYEGANLVIYTKDVEFFVKGVDKIRQLASKIKKRIHLRIHPDYLTSEDFAEVKIKEIVPKEAELQNLFFDPKRSIVFIEVKRPEKITKEIIDKIKEETRWFPIIKRSPLMPSKVTEVIRFLLYKSSEYRKKFLNDLGEQIYKVWEKGNNYWIRVSFLGGAREVGRSAILVQTRDSSILLDCGVNVALDISNPNATPRFDVPEFEIGELDAVIISHAHLDHCGLVPLLFKYGYRGPVYVTPPTLDIMVALQLDFIDVLQKEGKNPPYTSKEIHEMIKHVVTLDYFQVTDIAPDIRLTFYPAGHVLGSALIHLNIGNGTHNILYTGDFKFRRTKLHDPAFFVFERVETLIMESTYGGKEDIQPPREECEKQLIEAINKTINEKRGKVLIPVLGLGRAQEVMVIIEEAWRKGLLPKDIEVYVDGMIWDITAIYTAYPEYLSKEMRKLIIEEGYNPFEAEIFKKVGSDKEREEIALEKGPCVILATSGMLTGGPSKEYFRLMAEDPKNTLIFVSYQAEGTLGRVVKDGAKEVMVETREGRRAFVKVNLEVISIDGLSGHADRKELLKYLEKITAKPKRIFVVHGEPKKSLELAGAIKAKFNIEPYVPRVMDALRVY